MDGTGVWVAPLLLIPAVGLLILSTSARFGQLHEEFHRQRAAAQSQAIVHLCQRARLIHSALISLYVSVAVFAMSSLLGSLAGRWFENLTWIPETLTFVGVLAVTFAAVQLVRESRLLMTVLLDDAEREFPDQ